ncbi:MAG: hypothetical protein LBH20_06820 [Treponema sp.]|nr:hypothetical protein [Treponema sp.]
MRVLIDKLRLLAKSRFLTKPGAAASLILLILLLLLAGIFAITQEASDSVGDSPVRGDSHPSDLLSNDLFSDFQDDEEEIPPEWMPPGPPRWFRSNAGGMTLEEVPSRLAALRNKYALVIDYIAPDEIDPRLQSFYQEGYTIEIRALYEQRKEFRRQWLFRDEAGVTRINAVFKRQSDAVPEEKILDEEIVDEEISEDELLAEESAQTIELAAEIPLEEESSPAAISDDAMPDPEPPVLVSSEESPASVGFIEVYNEKTQIIEDHWLFEDDSELLISYFYNWNTLVKAETGKKMPVLASDAEPEQYRETVYHPMYTDTYRYNRSYSLRYVERMYHERIKDEPVRLIFPGRVLDAASDNSFMRDKLSLRSDFLQNFSAEEGSRILYDTDGRGRILTQTLINSKNETVWVIKNTWLGDRIVAMRKTEGENEKLVEYEYDNGGKQVVQRDINNGVLERMVHTKGENETEELYLNGVVVMRAYWEKGRKIKEEPVRRR